MYLFAVARNLFCMYVCIHTKYVSCMITCTKFILYDNFISHVNLFNYKNFFQQHLLIFLKSLYIFRKEIKAY